MKISMRKRYDLVKAAMDKAKQGMASGKHGILAIDSLIEAETAAGKLVFDMLFCDQGDDEDLQPLVSKRVLLQLIYATVDYRSSIQSRINQEKSRAGMRGRIKLLYTWLDHNIASYPQRLEKCAEDAAEQINGLRMAAGTVKKHITQYRKLNKPTTNKSSIKSKKKTKVAS